MPYCVMVKRASLGNSIKAVLKDLGCLASAQAMGIIEPEDFFVSGMHYNRLVLYRDLSVSKSVRRNMTLCQHRDQVHGWLAGGRVGSGPVVQPFSASGSRTLANVEPDRA
ncbi:DUF169 domain-containing protein [bacterium]|nr:DUF169 domain-containing protein [bacterium]